MTTILIPESFSDSIKRIALHPDFSAMHVSLFTALFLCYQRHQFLSPFPITRKTLMTYACIGSIATYHKCIRELQIAGFIRYQPSNHPKSGSLIYWADNEVNAE